MNDFLPEGYKVPSGKKGGYMKFVKGDNKFRILPGEAIVGMVCWTNPNSEGKVKPVRFRMNEKIEGNFKDSPKHFWGMVVWNYGTESVEILEITQKSVQEGIQNISSNEKWGHPSQYDLTISRSGDGLETKYTVSNDPKEKVDKDILKKLEETEINLEALFDGADPFEGKSMSDDKEALSDLPF